MMFLYFFTWLRGALPSQRRPSKEESDEDDVIIYEIVSFAKKVRHNLPSNKEFEKAIEKIRKCTTSKLHNSASERICKHFVSKNSLPAAAELLFSATFITIVQSCDEKGMFNEKDNIDSQLGSVNLRCFLGKISVALIDELQKSGNLTEAVRYKIVLDIGTALHLDMKNS